MSDPRDPTQVNPPSSPGGSTPPPPPTGGTAPPPPPTGGTAPPPPQPETADGGGTPPGWSAPPPAGGAEGSGGNKKPLLIIGGVVVAVLLIVGAVFVLGGDDDGGGTVGSVDDVEQATIQILTEGSFIDPAEGAVESAGSGSGFIITEDGIAVTNNHVVTGAATIKVKVGGEDEELEAQLLGVDECSDLAVIDIEGGGFPLLEFAEQDPETGTEVFAAGFPLGDPEYTLTSGIISKADADPVVNRTSVDGVVESDARINPGNSGGPLVDQTGQVVGVNFAGNTETDQNFAIKASLARELVPMLREGNVDAIGANTSAIASEDGTVTGIWVAAVAPGSPASEAGLEAGDLITEMNGLRLATDGTMDDYCDVLGSAGSDGTISAVVLRTETGEVLEGEINGSSPLAVVGSAGGGSGDPGEIPSGETVTVTSGNGGISAEVPAEWQVETTEQGFNAGPDVEAFNTSFAEPGVTVTLIEGTGDPGSVITEFLTSTGGDTACDETGREDFDNGVYAGTQVSLVCADGASEVLLVVGDSGTGNTVLVLVQATNAVEAEQGAVVINTVTEL